MMQSKAVLNSVIDTFDYKTAFECILNFFDPFKTKNRKTKVLDMGTSYYWNDDQNLYDVTKTKNIHGYAKDKKYNIIIYEPPKNIKFQSETKIMAELFRNMLFGHGIVVVKITDFRVNDELKGTYEITNVFKETGYVLFDNIICKTNRTTEDVSNSHSLIQHYNYLIFKREDDVHEKII